MVNVKQGNILVRLSYHLKKYLIIYTIIVLLLGVLCGNIWSEVIIENKSLLKSLIVLFAILTIYPSMIQLKTEHLMREFKNHRAMITGVIYVFIVSPLVAITLSPLFRNKMLSIGFVVSNIVPASSASIGYVLIAEGSIEVATALAIISLVGAVLLIPVYIGLYGTMISVAIPINKILMSIIYTLIIPMILGQATRYPLVKVKGTRFVNIDLKPYLSLATILSMLILITLLIMREATYVFKMPLIVVEIIVLQSIIILMIFGLSTYIDKLINLNYESHMAVAFLSATKNQSVAAVIAVMAFGALASLPPAIIPAIQAPLCIAYLHLDKKIRKYFERN